MASKHAIIIMYSRLFTIFNKNRTTFFGIQTPPKPGPYDAVAINPHFSYCFVARRGGELLLQPERIESKMRSRETARSKVNRDGTK
jgi:hypothetical protein